jgi:tetratricopeptide (TPR) repeat protein
VVASSHLAPRGGAAWLYGRSSDLLLGAGAGYLLTLPLLLWLGSRLALEDWPIEVTLALGLLVSTPHYGATLLRVYERPQDRRRYRLLALHASLVLAGLFVAGLHHPGLGSLLVTLYFVWSPWHFAGQNYGLSLMFLRRRGIPVEAAAKRALYAAYLSSFGIAFLAFQMQSSSVGFAPEFVADGERYATLSLGIPRALAEPGAALLLVGYGAALLVAGYWLWRAGARAGDLVAPALLAISQAQWFVLPALFATQGEPLRGLAFTAVWVSIAHSVQYLWVTSYYAKQSGSERRLVFFYVKALLAGCLLGEIPALLFAPQLLGPISWSGGLAILLFAVINLHHFILDGAVWKLRDGRVARLLLRTQPGDAPAAPGARAGPWGVPALVWSLGALCLAIPLLELWDAHAVRSPDVERVEGAARRLAWIGRERIGVLNALGALRVQRGEAAKAEAAYRRALTLRRDPTVLNNLAWTLAVADGHGSAAAREAVALSEEAVAHFGPDDAAALDTLAAAYAAAGRYADATRVAEQALAHARQSELAAPLRQRLTLYRAGRAYQQP